MNIICKYCDTEYKSVRSKSQHEWKCKSNPDAKVAQNQYTKANRLGLPKPEISDETRKLYSDRCKGIPWSRERKAEFCLTMQQVVRDNPDSYSESKLAGRKRVIEYDEISFDSPWEIDFYKWCKSKDIEVVRNKNGFSYQWNGTRTYFPDFYLPEFDLYVEIKGYETERCTAKISQFKDNLLVLKWDQIHLIRDDVFEIQYLME